MPSRNTNIKKKGSNGKAKAPQVLLSVSKGPKLDYSILMEKIEVLDIKLFMNWEAK